MSLALLGLAVVLTGVLLGMDGIPLGVPGEWTWDRIPLRVDHLLTGVLGGFAGGLYVAVAWWGGRRFSGEPRTSVAAAWLSLLMLAGGLFWFTLLQTLPEAYGYGRVPFVLYYPRSSGYFWQARYEVENLGTFLREYETLLSEEDYLHIGTHPPGLTTLLHLLLTLCREIGPLREFVLWTEPAVVAEVMQGMRGEVARGGGTFDRADEATLWLAGLLVQGGFLLGCVGLYGLVRLGGSPLAAWRTASIWPLLPGALVFFPKSDVLFPALGIWCCLCWFRGWLLGRDWCCILAGLLAWCGMMLSLAIATVLVLIGLATLWLQWNRATGLPSEPALHEHVSNRSPSANWRSLARSLAWGTAGFLGPCLLVWLACGLNLLRVWSWNLHNHALFYSHNPRTWWVWLLINPLELALTLGLPVTFLGLITLVCHVSFSTRGSTTQARPRSCSPALCSALVLAWGIVMIGLWFSGKNMGEAARLWILLTPWPLLGLTGLWSRPTSSSSLSREADRAQVLWLSLLIAQSLVCLLTVSRVDGFHFSEFVSG